MEETDDEGMTTVYAKYDDGSIDQISYSGDTLPPLSKPGHYIEKAEYDVLAAEMEAANQAYLDELRRQEQEAVHADYLALRAAGVPEATARRLTGYTGP